jgi:gluconolactonase
VKEKIRFFSRVKENTAEPKEIIGEPREKESGFLIFSDVPRNEVLRWTAAEGIRVYVKPSGYTGIVDYRPEPGSNGLAVDREGRIAFCEHGDRRVSLLYKEGGKRTLADNYEGKRLNSPNDLVFNSKGDLYFTDPPYGLPKQLKDSRCELGYCGVYRLPGATPGGKLTLLTKELTRPNGLAFSPDEKTLYVANSDPEKAIWMAYEVQPDGGIDKGRVFFDATSLAKKHKGLPDGMKVDLDGNIYATGPGGIFIFAPDGTHLGMLYTGQATGNCAWGDDGSTLYICADMYLCRVRLKTKGF